MKILILHLSDIHIKEGTQSLKEKAEKIVNGIKNLENGVVRVIIVITGDIAFSGNETEYVQAFEFLDSLRDYCTSLVCQDVSFIIIPGNHDCLILDGKEEARNVLIETIRSNGFKRAESSIMDIIVKNQDTFFSSCFGIYCEEPEKISEHRLFYQFYFIIDNFRICFNCINTSWCSIKNEDKQYGKMGYVTEYLTKKIDSECSISLLHHPYNWFTQEISKELRNHLELNSSLILTGHEHEADQSEKSNFKGKYSTLYLEGGVLIDQNNPDQSSFNAVYIDSLINAFCIYQLNIVDNLYLSDKVTDSWLPLSQYGRSLTTKFKINSYFQKWLNDPGATIFYQYKNSTLTLEDVFVYPELKNTYNEEDSISVEERINSEKLLNLKLEANRFFIIGTESIGKTTLLKKIYVELFNKDYIPIYIDGKDIKETSDDYLWKLILKLSKDQYDESNYQLIEQSDKSKFFVLIDNFHNSSLNLKYKARFLANNFTNLISKTTFTNVLICANDYLGFEELVYKDEHFINPLIYFENYRLLPFGNRLRYNLIEKWYKNQNKDISDEDLIQKIEYAEKLINENIGRNFIPKYPLFILVHLHGIDLNRQNELKTSSHGYYYEFLIVTAISRKDMPYLDSYLTYLTQFAYFLYDKKQFEITIDQFEDFDKNIYRIDRRISKTFEQILEFLLEVGIIEERNHLYRIKHNYIYYFFLARYFRDTINSKDTRDIIIQLIDKLYEDENSNILIFLTHLSKDSFIVDTLLAKSKMIFSDFPALEINNDCDAIDNLIETIPNLIVENENIQKNRETKRERLSINETLTEEASYNHKTSTDEVDSATVLFVNNIRLAIKSIQVLGQIAKNYHGSLTIAKLDETVEETYLLGLRSINFFISFLNRYTEFVISFVKDKLTERLAEKNIDLDDAEKIIIAKNIVFSSCVVAIGNMIKNITRAIGSQELEESYKVLYKKYDWNSIKLIDVSIKLDNYYYFPIKDVVDVNKSLRKKNISNMLLKLFAKEYLEMYPVKVEILQKVSAELGLEMKTLRILTHNQRMK